MATSWRVPTSQRVAGECGLESGSELLTSWVQGSFDCLVPDETGGFEKVWSRTPSGQSWQGRNSSALSCSVTSCGSSGSVGGGGGKLDSATLLEKMEFAAANLQDANLPGHNRIAASLGVQANIDDWLSMCSTESVSPSTSTRWNSETKSRASASAEGLMTLCVGLDPPHRVIRSSENCLEFLGFSPREIVGKKLNVLEGPMTDTIELERLVGRCMCEELTKFGKRIIFYKSDGEEVEAKVSLRKVQVDTEGREKVHACELTLQKDQGIQLCGEEEVYQEDEDEDEDVELPVQPASNLSCCTVRADERFTIESLSTPFMSMFGLLETQAVGRGISVIYSCRESKHAWTELLDVAVRTRMQTVQVVKVCDAFCDEFTATVHCTPIFSGDGEFVERLHLVFESFEPHDEASLMSKFKVWCSGKWHCRDASSSPSVRSGATTRHDSTVSVIEDYPTASCSQG